MIWQNNPYSYPLFFAAVLSVALALRILRRRASPGATGFSLLLLAVAEWSLTATGEFSSADLPSILLWDKAVYMGVVTIPVAWMVFVLQYTGRAKWLRARNLSFLCLVPVATLLLDWTNEIHRLIFNTFELVSYGSLSIVEVTWGMWFWLFAAYSYVLITLGTVMLLRSSSLRKNRGQMATLVAALLVPLVASGMDIFGSVYPVDLTPLAFTFTGFAIFFGVFRFRLFEIMPVAREVAIQDMADGMIVLDISNRVVDINSAGAQMIGYGAKEAIGKPISELLKELKVHGSTGLPPALTLTRDGSRHDLDVRQAPLYDMAEHLVGHVAVMRDVTERMRAELKLRLQAEITENMFEGLVLVREADGVIVQTNPRFESMFGYNAGELIGKNIATVNAPIDGKSPEDRAKEIIASLRQTGSWKGEVRNVKKDGTTFWCQANVSTLVSSEYGRIWVATHVDLTERKRLEETLHRRAQELDSLQETLLEITGQHELPLLLNGIVERAAQLLDAPGGGMYLCDPEKQEVRCVVAYNTKLNAVGFVLKYGEGAAGLVAQTGKPLIIDDYRTWLGRAAAYEKDKPFGAVISAPMIWDRKVVGVIHALRYEANRFTENDLELLTMFANHAAIAVENAKLLERVEQHAVQLKGMVEERTNKLAASEKRFRDFADLLPQLAFETDMNGRLIFVNRAASTLTGYSYEDLRGLNALQLVVPEEQERAKENLSRVLHEEKLLPHEYTVVKKDGTTFPVVLDSAPLIRESKVIGMRAVAVDITERKRMEEELRAAKQRLEYVVAANPAAIYSGKPLADCSDWHLTYISDRVTSMLGYEPKEFVGHPEFWESHIHPDSLKPTLAAISHFFKEGHHTFDYRFLHKDGTYRWLREEANLARDSAGRPLEVYGYWTDVTELKQLEEQVAASTRVATIGQTAAMVAHDIRNPLQALTTAVYVLKQQLRLRMDETTRRMLEVIESSVQRSDNLVKDLLDYSKDLHLDFKETSPRSIVKDCLLLVQIPKKITVQDYTEDRPKLELDVPNIQRAFVNIINNAIAAMPEGGELRISSRASEDNVEFSFADTGSGMTQATLNTLWVPFKTTRAKGVGLGLAICKRIIEAHSGSISVDSALGKGTTFLVTLPLRPVGRR